MKTIAYLIDCPAGTVWRKFGSSFEMDSDRPERIADNQEFCLVDASLSGISASGNEMNILNISQGFVDIVYSSLFHCFIDDPGSNGFDDIVEFEGFLISRFPTAFILRMEEDVVDAVPLRIGGCWPLFPHSIERFYQWLSQSDPARWTILNDQPRRTDGALEAMKELLNRPILHQNPVPPTEAFAFTNWPEVRGDPQKNIPPGLIIDETVTQSFLGESLSKSIDVDLFHDFMDLANAGRRLLQAGIANVIIASPPKSFDAVLKIQEEPEQAGEIFQCATIKTDYIHHMLRILDQGTWHHPRLVVDLAQHTIDLRMFEIAFFLFLQEVILKRTQLNSERPRSGKISAIFLEGKHVQLKNFNY